MKVIDLLNKIANGEDLPKKIEIRTFIFKLRKNYKEYNINYTYEDDFENYWLDMMSINEEVRIIEEDKEIEKITKRTNKVLKRELIYKINELTDAVNELKKGK